MRVPKGYRRNGDSPTEGIETTSLVTSMPAVDVSRNGDSPTEGIETPSLLLLCGTPITVEMETARLRALKPSVWDYLTDVFNCRNGDSPTEGIETSALRAIAYAFMSVEMETARLRALKLGSLPFMIA